MALPRTIVSLHAGLRTAGRFSLVPAGSGIRRGLKEKDYDELIVHQKETIAELLCDTGILGERCTLKYLGRGIANIDVLFAEVLPNGSFRRLVLVEDKLLRNPQARRTVLAQILDYAHKVQYELTPEQLLEEVDDQQWVERNRDDIEGSLRTGDCLLLICGDEIHVRVATLAERFAKQANPLSRCQLALIAMNLYSDGKHHLLVPALVDAVTGSERDLTIRVAVLDQAGRVLKSTHEVVQDEVSGKQPKASQEEFLKNEWSRFSPAENSACLTVLKILEQAPIPGFRKDLLRSGRPVFVFDNTNWGRVAVLRVMHTKPALRDSLEANKAIQRNKKAIHMWQVFRKALLEIKGAHPAKHRIVMPVIDLESDGCQGLIRALRAFGAALRRS